MATVTINGKAFDLESMTDESKAILVSIQFVDTELRRLKAQEAAYSVARASYSNALSKALGIHDESDEPQDAVPDTISFD